LGEDVDLISEDEVNQTTFHQINDELLNTFIKEKEQERQNSKKPKLLSSNIESNGGMYYCLTVEDVLGGPGAGYGLDTARYGAMTSTL
jgi:hypothetical protein